MVVIVLSFGLIVFLAIIKIIALRFRQKKINDFKSQWGKIKEYPRNMDLISIYYERVKQEIPYPVDEKTWSDLDMDYVFKRIDATTCRIGAQKLYQILHSPNFNLVELQKFDNMIEYFNENTTTRIEVQIILNKLTNRDLAFFPLLFTEKLPPKPHYFWIYPLLSIFTLAIIIICFFIPHLIWILIMAFISCMILHYANKIKIGSYIDSFRNISRITRALKKLLNLNLSCIDNPMLKQEILKSNSITRKTNWLSNDYSDSNELTSLFLLIFEIIKGALLLEPILFYSAIKSIDKNKARLKYFFELIGVIDTAISVASFRQSLKLYCKPEFTNNSTSIIIKRLYHPIIDNCIENDISISNKSVLITGSNMAGKSTFIRAVGINAILSQTIFTSISSQYNASFKKVATSINITDNILYGKSYFQQEIDSIKRLIIESQKEEKCIFIIDEIFKGTNTFDRIAISKSVLSFLASQNTVFVSTHDVELAGLLDHLFDLYYFHENIIDDQMTFDFKLNKGIPLKSNAIKLLELNNYPASILHEALQYKIKH